MKRHTTSDLREPWYIRWDSAEPGARQGVLKHRTKRGYKAPPFVLDVLIGLTAGFPPGCALPRSFSWPEDENAALEQLEYYSQDLGDKLKHWIFGEGGIRLAIDRFTSATNIWRALRAVAQASMNFSENAADLEPEPLRVDVPTTIWIDPSRGYSLITME